MPVTRPRRDECLNTDTATTTRPSAAASSRNPGPRTDRDTVRSFRLVPFRSREQGALSRGNFLRRLLQGDASLRSLSPRPVHNLLAYRRRPLFPVPLMQLGTLSQQQYRTRRQRVARGHWATTGPRITDRPRWQMTCPSS